MTMSILKILSEQLSDGMMRLNEPMRLHTSFKIGGDADLFVMPETIGQLAFAVQSCRTNGVRFAIIGNGSNLLVSDAGVEGCVISTKGLRGMGITDNVVHAQAGLTLKEVARYALGHELSGLEFADGIPGTVGGGIFMNAGAYGGEIAQVFMCAEVINANGELTTMNFDEMRFAYRQSAAQDDDLIIAGAAFELQKGGRTEILTKINDYNGRRKDKQPLEYPSAGSTFKRPKGEGLFAGKLIQDAGLAGHTIGGAQISAKHCGFIINIGCATAADVNALMEYAQRIVFEQFGVWLEREVKFIGRE